MDSFGCYPCCAVPVTSISLCIWNLLWCHLAIGNAAISNPLSCVVSVRDASKSTCHMEEVLRNETGHECGDSPKESMNAEVIGGVCSHPPSHPAEHQKWSTRCTDQLPARSLPWSIPPARFWAPRLRVDVIWHH
jgi:hypothetical protein